jgi:hypothetical protein
MIDAVDARRSDPPKSPTPTSGVRRLFSLRKSSFGTSDDNTKKDKSGFKSRFKKSSKT